MRFNSSAWQRQGVCAIDDDVPIVNRGIVVIKMKPALTTHAFVCVYVCVMCVLRQRDPGEETMQLGCNNEDTPSILWHTIVCSLHSTNNMQGQARDDMRMCKPGPEGT